MPIYYINYSLYYTHHHYFHLLITAMFLSLSGKKFTIASYYWIQSNICQKQWHFLHINDQFWHTKTGSDNSIQYDSICLAISPNTIGWKLSPTVLCLCLDANFMLAGRYLLFWKTSYNTWTPKIPLDSINLLLCLAELFLHVFIYHKGYYKK